MAQSKEMMGAMKESVMAAEPINHCRDGNCALNQTAISCDFGSACLWGQNTPRADSIYSHQPIDWLEVSSII